MFQWATIKSLYFEYYNKSSNVKFGEIEIEQNWSYKTALKLDWTNLEKWNTLKSYFPKSKNFLDIGAAFGDMISIALENGLDSQGIELSDYCREKVLKEKNIQLLDKELNSLKSSSYDLIHLNHVFEHFVKPREELIQIKRVLKNNGGLYIEIPFQFHLIERIKNIFNKRKNFDLYSIHHPYL